MVENYEDLLDNVQKNLPDKIKHGERFEMPKFDYFVEGNRTMIRNFKVVCDKLRRTPQQLTKFLSKELAVPAEVQGERLILQRRVMAEILDKKLDDFVNKYVLCNQCKKPDTHIDEAGRGLLILVCESCGARRTIKD